MVVGPIAVNYEVMIMNRFIFTHDFMNLAIFMNKVGKAMYMPGR